MLMSSGISIAQRHWRTTFANPSSSRYRTIKAMPVAPFAPRSPGTLAIHVTGNNVIRVMFAQRSPWFRSLERLFPGFYPRVAPRRYLSRPVSLLTTRLTEARNPRSQIQPVARSLTFQHFYS